MQAGAIPKLVLPEPAAQLWPVFLEVMDEFFPTEGIAPGTSPNRATSSLSRSDGFDPVRKAGRSGNGPAGAGSVRHRSRGRKGTKCPRRGSTNGR